MNMYPFNSGMSPANGYSIPQMPQTNNWMASPIQAPKTEIPRVNGEESIRSYPMGPDSTMIFVSSDPNSDVGWIVATDSAAYKTIRKCHIIPDIQEEPVKASDLEERFQRIESRFNDIEERMKANEQYALKPSWTAATGTDSASADRTNIKSGQ